MQIQRNAVCCGHCDYTANYTCPSCLRHAEQPRTTDERHCRACGDPAYWIDQASGIDTLSCSECDCQVCMECSGPECRLNAAELGVEWQPFISRAYQPPREQLAFIW